MREKRPHIRRVETEVKKEQRCKVEVKTRNLAVTVMYHYNISTIDFFSLHYRNTSRFISKEFNNGNIQEVGSTWGIKNPSFKP